MVGGLSGITYDPASDSYTAISDDRAQISDARTYDLTIDLDDGALSDGDVDFTSVTTLLDTDGLPFAPLSLDPEGIALNSDGNVVRQLRGRRRRQPTDPALRAGVRAERRDADRTADPRPVPPRHQLRTPHQPRVRVDDAHPGRVEAVHRHGERPRAGRPGGHGRATPVPRGSLSTDPTREPQAQYVYEVDEIRNPPGPGRLVRHQRARRTARVRRRGHLARARSGPSRPESATPSSCTRSGPAAPSTSPASMASTDSRPTRRSPRSSCSTSTISGSPWTTWRG